METNTRSQGSLLDSEAATCVRCHATRREHLEGQGCGRFAVLIGGEVVGYCAACVVNPVLPWATVCEPCEGRGDEPDDEPDDEGGAHCMRCPQTIPPGGQDR